MSRQDDDGYFETAHRLRLGRDQLDWKRYADAIDKYLKLHENANKPIGGSTINPARLPNLDHFRSTFGDVPIDAAIDRKRAYEDALNSIHSRAQLAIEKYFLNANPQLKEIGRQARPNHEPNSNADGAVGRLLLELAAADLVKHFHARA